MKFILKSNNFELKFKSEYTFYNVCNACAGKAFTKNVEFSHDDLEELIRFNKALGLPAMQFFTKKGDKTFRLHGNELREENYPLEYLSLELVRATETPLESTEEAKAKQAPKKTTKRRGRPSKKAEK